MSIIIGSTTTITAFDTSEGFLSFSFSDGVNVERLYRVGSFSEHLAIPTINHTVNLTMYGGARSQTVGLSPSTSCSDATSYPINIDGVGCGIGGSLNISESLWPSSYSYSKEYRAFGQESWAFVSKPVIQINTASVFTLVMLLGKSDGRMTGSGSGVTFEGTPVEGHEAAITAGANAAGDISISKMGIAVSIGASVGAGDGVKGSASVTIPHQAIYSF